MKGKWATLLFAVFLTSLNAQLFASGVDKTQTHSVANQLAEGIEAFDKQKFPVAFKLLRPLAENGDAAAQGYLGEMFHTGNGVAQDVKQAAAWYRKAAVPMGSLCSAICSRPETA